MRNKEAFLQSLIADQYLDVLAMSETWIYDDDPDAIKAVAVLNGCYAFMHGLAPPYLATDCISISSLPGRRQLRSATSGQLYIPRTKTMTFGPRSFKVSGPTIWNDLPARLKDSSLSKNFFRKLFNTFLFDR